jgi:hypothetical protein
MIEDGSGSLNDSAVYRTSTALRQRLSIRLDFLRGLNIGKEHRGRNVLCFQPRPDLGSWHSTAELLPRWGKSLHQLRDLRERHARTPRTLGTNGRLGVSIFDVSIVGLGAL